MNSVIIEPVETPDGLSNAKIHYKGRTIMLHSLQPYREAERIVTKFNRSLQWVLIAGLGLGYTVEYILKNTPYSVILFEPESPIFDYALQSARVKKILADKRVNLIRNGISGVTDFLDNNLIRELNFYISRLYLTIFPETLSELDGKIAAYLSKKQINKSTLKRFQKVWVKNIIKNSSFYFKLPGIRDINHNFEKKPAIIAGAGPSLAINVGQLKRYQDRVAIISTDTAYISLLSNGIQPDFIVSVDPQDKNSLYILYAFRNDAFLVIDSTASIQSFIKYNSEKTFIYDSIFPFYDELKMFWGEKGRLSCGGSVSTTAFDLARFLKCDPIIFIGQDLSYPQKHTHIKGSILEEFLYHKIDRFNTFESYNAKALLLSDRIEIEGWYGTRVSTDRKFLTFLEWFKKEFKNTGTRIINSTEGGALMEGAEHLPLRDVLKPLDNEKTLDKSISYNIRCGIGESGFIDLLKVITIKMDNLLIYSEKARKAAEAALHKFSANTSIDFELRSMSEFDKLFRKYLKENPVLARLIEFTMQESIDIVNLFHDSNLNIETLNVWHTFYEEASEGLAYLSRLINKRLRSSAGCK